MRATIVINPVSGTGGRPEAVRRRAALASAFLERRGIRGEVCLTERPGHARELASAARNQGTELVVAWGGDGTVNEVASVLAFTAIPIAIIPSGSGNGLARELAIPADPGAALRVAFDGRERRIDAGELNGRLFFNIAGAGLDARVAHRFAALGAGRRGLARYLALTARELFGGVCDDFTVVMDTTVVCHRTLLIAIANGRQYGNGALIAPSARLDDGRLDVVIVQGRPMMRVLMQVPKVFAGRIDRVPGVSIHRVERVEITCGQPIVFHVDGEPCTGGQSLAAHVHPGALTVRVP